MEINHTLPVESHTRARADETPIDEVASEQNSVLKKTIITFACPLPEHLGVYYNYL